MDTASDTASDTAASLPLVSQLRSQIESILLVVDSPVGVEALARALGVDTAGVEKQ